MDHFEQIYTTQAEAYHRMIAAEDADGHLRATLERVCDWPGARWLDVGTGTGRLPLMLREAGGRGIGLDRHLPMLLEQARQRDRVGESWPLVQADVAALPFAGGAFDVVTAGWALGHTCGWHPDDWRIRLAAMLDEIGRVLVPGGRVVIIETLTTGAREPAPPTAALGEFYAWLEGDRGFARHTLRTDYAFPDVETAVAATEFFFGEVFANTVRANGWSRVPEWTGVWLGRTD